MVVMLRVNLKIFLPSQKWVKQTNRGGLFIIKDSVVFYAGIENEKTSTKYIAKNYVSK